CRTNAGPSGGSRRAVSPRLAARWERSTGRSTCRSIRGAPPSRASPPGPSPRLLGRGRTPLPRLHPGKAAETDAGWLGELHPALLEGAWGVFELDVARLMAPRPERILYEDVITYPAVRQDVAVVVDEDVEAGSIVAVTREAG